MKVKNLIVRVAGGAAALGLMAAAFGAAPGSADACSGPACQQFPSRDPTNIPQLAPQGPQKPDLVVWFDKVTCTSGILQLKVRVQNQGPNPAGSFVTEVEADGMMLPGSPHLTPGPVWGGQVFHISKPMSPGAHVITAFVDSGLQVSEFMEGNNMAIVAIAC
jgi:hypothetical protein